MKLHDKIEPLYLKTDVSGVGSGVCEGWNVVSTGSMYRHPGIHEGRENK